MKRQDIFDTVVKHLFKQKRQAFTRPAPGVVFTGCAYRTPDKLKCAIGCLIPDELYDPSLEGATMASIAEGARRDFGIPILKLLGGARNKELLSDLQEIHDNAEAWNNLSPTDKRRIRHSAVGDYYMGSATSRAHAVYHTKGFVPATALWTRLHKVAKDYRLNLDVLLKYKNTQVKEASA